jgi:hypothetical protein
MAKKEHSGGSGGKRGQFKKGRRPHNAKTLEFDNIGDLVRKLGAEPRRVLMNGKEVEMTAAERSLRLAIDRALKGNVRDLAALLRLMIKYPNVTGPGKLRMIYFVRGALADV